LEKEQRREREKEKEKRSVLGTVLKTGFGGGI
jgi:hypothetical protein